MTDSVTADSAKDSASEARIPSLTVRVVNRIGWVLIYLSLLTVGFVIHQLWITTWLAQQNQNELDTERETHFATAVITEVEYTPQTYLDTEPEIGGEDSGSVSQGTMGSTPDIVLPARPRLKVESAPEPHLSFALIRIPALPSMEDGWNVVEGVRRSDLKTGAGHVPWTPLPGQPGNAVISGHRTSYGAPFRALDELESGDRIEVETALGTHVYEVRESTVVAPTDTWVLSERAGAWLTLTTCHPVLSARQRLVIFAELVDGPNSVVINGS